MNYIVYLTYPAMLVLLLVGAKWSKKGRFNEEFLNLEQTKYIQGFLAVCIMLHHIAQETCASWNQYPALPGLEMFVPIGYFFVSVFIFCSGYGLFKSFRAKENYLKGFFGKRILPVIVAFYSTGLIFLLARLLMKEQMTKSKWVLYLTGFGLPNLYGWFAVAMPWFYLCFYLSFRFFKKDGMKIFGTFLGVFLYTFLGTWVNHNSYWLRGEWWYNCVHLFWIGLLFARYEERIVKWLKKYYWLALALTVIGTAVFYIASKFATGIFSYYGEYNWKLSHWIVVRNRWICLATEALACMNFCFVVVILNLKLKIGNGLLKLMGKITLEFYLIHGLILEFFSYRFCDTIPGSLRITNVALLIVVVFVLAIPAALLVQKLDGWIVKLLTGKLKKCGDMNKN